MKRLELISNIVSIFIDAILLVAAGSLAYFLRFRAQSLFPQYPILFDLRYSDFLKNILVALPFVILIFSLYGLYNLKSTRRAWSMTLRIAAAISTCLMVFVAVYFFDSSIFPSRLIVLMTWVFAVVLVGTGRLLLLGMERGFLRRGIGLHKLVLIRAPGTDYNLAQQIGLHPTLGYRIVRTLVPESESSLISELQRIRAEEGIDDILQANVDLSPRANADILHFTHDYNIGFHHVPNIIESQQTNIAAMDIAGIPVIELKNTPLDGWGKVVKRIVDVILSLTSIVVLSPMLLLLTLLVKLDSPGRALFVQERYGQGRPFRFYKFRSMYQELSVGADYGGQKAEEVRKELWKKNVRNGPFLKIKDDPRVTRFGRILRKTKLDELPQLFNVLTGEMSLVGPRAHILEEVELYRSHYRRQFTIKPGITGLTQIAQTQTPDLPFEEEIRLNTFYLENWSLGLDLKILLNTFLVLLRRSKKDENY